METDFWENNLIGSTADIPSGRDEYPADLLSFVANSYQLNIPLIDTTSPNIERRLGGGTSSAVHLFRLGHRQDAITGQTRKQWHIEADKAVAIKRPTTPEERRSMLNELRILSHPPLRGHRNIVDILGWSFRADRWSVEPLLIVEASTCGDLSKFLFDGTLSSAEQAISISIDITLGLHALHNAEVVHGDIKSCNILLFMDSKDSIKSYRAKLCDFGFSLILSDYTKCKDRISLPRSVPYNAPECKPGAEILLSEVYKADIFSYGMVLWDLWSRGFISKSDASEIESKKQGDALGNEIQQSIKTHTGLNQRLEAVLWSIFDDCLHLNPQRRIKELTQLLPRFSTLASRTDTLEKNIINDGPLIKSDIAMETDNSEPLSSVAPIFAGGDELVRSTITLGRNVKSIIFADLKARATSGKSLQLFAIHYLLSFCYLTGYGIDINLPLAVEHMAKSAIAGSAKALSMLPQYCKTLGIEFPTELLGLSEKETEAWIATAGYPRPLFQISLPVPDKSIEEYLQVSTAESKGLTKVSLTEEKLPNNRNIISLAIIQQQKERMKDLESKIYKENQDIQSQDSDGNSVLHLACFLGNVNETLRLLKRGAKPFANKKGITPLHWLSQFPIDSTELILNSLLGHGADVNAVSVGGGIAGLHPAEWVPPGTPLSWAVFAKRQDAVLLLLSHGANPLLPGFKSALEVAAHYHEYEILRDLLDAMPQPTPDADAKKSRPALIDWAIESNSLTNRIVRHGPAYRTAADLTIRLLIERKYDVSTNPPTGLRYSITGNHSESNLDIMQCLLENGSANPAVLELESPSEDKLTPIHVAMAASGRAMFKMLIEYGADVNHAAGIRKYTCLHGCSRADDEDATYFAKVLLEGDGIEGVELEARDVDGRTPFMLACRFQRTELAKYLLSKGSDAYAIDNEGYTVVSSCASRATFIYLLEIIPNLAEHDYICHPSMGVTILHYVAEWDEVVDGEALPFLSEILHVAPELVNKVTKLNGRSALFSTVRRGNLRMVEMLLASGANISIRDMNGMTAVQLASGIYLASKETGQDARALKMATIYSRLHHYMATEAGDDKRFNSSHSLIL